MTQTMRTQINKLADAVSALSAAHPGEPVLLAMAWSFEEAANLAHGRLRHLFDVPINEASTQAVTPVTPVASTQDLPESERRILEYVQAHPGVTIDQTASATGYSRNTTGVVLRTLMRRGQIHRQHGKSAKWWPK